MANNKYGSVSYDPKKVRLLINLLDVTGFIDGDKITISPVTKEDVKSFIGVDGDVSFSEVHDDRRMIKFTLKAESPWIKILETLRKLRTGFPVSVKNTSAGAYIGGSTGCRIAEKPEVKFPKEDPQWEFSIIAPYWSGLPVEL